MLVTSWACDFQQQVFKFLWHLTEFSVVLEQCLHKMHYRTLDFSLWKKGSNNTPLRKDTQFNWIRMLMVVRAYTRCWMTMNQQRFYFKQGVLLPYRVGPFLASAGTCHALGWWRLCHCWAWTSSRPRGAEGHAKCHWKGNVLQVVNKISDIMYYSESSVIWMAAAFEWMIFLLMVTDKNEDLSWKKEAS